MGRLFENIRNAIVDDRYLIGEHAKDRLEERYVADWQVVAAFGQCRLISGRTGTRPNPSIEVIEILPDGTEIKAVWSWLSKSKYAKLVTIHFFDE